MSEFPIEYTQGSAKEPYETKVNPNGLLGCTCIAWRIKKPNKARGCKHCDAYAAKYGLKLEERDGQMFVVGKGTPAAPAKPSTGPAPSEFIQPMLASSMPEGSNAGRYSADEYVMEEKFDGHRIVMAVTAREVTAWSRYEKSRTLPAHIQAQALQLPLGVYDGELIVPGKHSYDVTAGMNSGTEVLVLFDLLRVLGSSVTSRTLEERRGLLLKAHQHINVDPLLLAVTVAKQQRPSQKAIDAIWKRGGEGVIIKRRSARYQPGVRSADWIKVKKVAAATLTIIGFEQGKAGTYSAVKIRDKAGVETTVKTLNNETIRQMERNPKSFIGRKLVISYQERTPSGSYRHPRYDHLAGDGE